MCTRVSFQTPLPFIYLNYWANILSISASLDTLLSVEWCQRDDGGTEQWSEGGGWYHESPCLWSEIRSLKKAATLYNSTNNSDKQMTIDYGFDGWPTPVLQVKGTLRHYEYEWVISPRQALLSLWEEMYFILVQSHCFRWGMCKQAKHNTHTHTHNEHCLGSIINQNVYWIPLGKQKIWSAINRTCIKKRGGNNCFPSSVSLVYKCRAYLFRKLTGVLTIFFNLEKLC